MITKEQWLNLVSKVDQTFEDEFKAEYNSPELMVPLIQRLLKQCNVSVTLPLADILDFLNKAHEALAKSEISQDEYIPISRVLIDAKKKNWRVIKWQYNVMCSL